MVSSLKGIALKFVKSNKFIVLSSIFSILISVSLLITLFTFINSAENSLRNDVIKTYGEMDLSVGYNGDSVKKIDSLMVDKISSLKNVKTVSKVLIGRLQVGKKQKLGVYSVGVDNDKLSKSRYHFVKDISSNEVILNKGLADGLNVKENEQIIINDRSFKIIEIIDDMKQSSSVMDMLFINRNTFKDMLKDGREATYLMFKTIDKNKNLDLVNGLKAIDNDFRIDIAEENESVKESINILKIYLSVLSILVIIMCSLFIISNFQTFLYNYRNQFALIRAVGGSSKQALKIVMIQCTVINIIGVISAILVSYVSSKYLINLLNNIFIIEVSEIKFSPFIALGISLCSFLGIQLFMLIPAIKSSRILPFKIMEENEKTEYNSKSGKRIGVIGICLSIFTLVFGLAKSGNSDNAMLLAVASAVFLILGTYKLFQYYAKHILNGLLPFLEFIGGRVAFVAVKSLIPQVRKSSVIILSISTTIIIAVFGGTLLNTVLSNTEENLRNQFALDIVVTDRSTNSSKLGTAFKNDLDKLSGVRGTSIISWGTNVYYQSENRVENMYVCFADLDTLIKEGKITDINGDLKSNIVITKGYAKKHNLAVGDVIKVKRDANDRKLISDVDPNLGFDTVRIGAIIDKIPAHPQQTVSAIFNWNDKYINDFTFFCKALISSEKVNNTLNDLNNLKKQYPQIKWTTLNQALNDSRQQFYQNYAFFIIVIAIILVTLFLGLFNSLINNIMSKRKEFAILRTLELNKIGLVKAVMAQVIIYNLLGIILGYILGLAVSNIVLMMDSQSKIVLDNKLIFAIGSLLVLISILIFVPFSIKLANKKISQEISFGTK